MATAYYNQARDPDSSCTFVKFIELKERNSEKLDYQKLLCNYVTWIFFLAKGN